jgi:outer membrane protein TolC
VLALTAFASRAVAQTAPSPSAVPSTAAPAPAPSAEPAPERPSATLAVPPPRADANAVPIDARTAIQRALGASPSLAANRLGARQAEQDVRAEEGRYPFVFQADAGYVRTASPRVAPDDSVRTSTSHSVTVGSALRRTFPTGTTAEIRVQGERFSAEGTTGAATGIAVQQTGTNGYGATARLTVTQPLMRGFGTEVGEAGLRAAEHGRTGALQARRRATSELVRDVLLAYWELWFADESLRIDQTALELALDQERQAEEQRAHGALAPADVLPFSSRVATLEQTMVDARTSRQQRSLELNRLMGTDPHAAPDLYASEIPVPGASPSVREIEAALRAGSIELAELETQVKLARTRAETAGDESRPRLDLDAYLQTYGESQDASVAATRAGQFNWITAHVGATYELPLDSSRKNAERESAILAVRIAEQNLKAKRDQLAAEAVLTVRQARAAEEQLSLAERSVSIAEKAHEAARGRFELGGGIALEVKQAEEDLQQARLSLARTRVDLVQAQIAMQHLAGTLAPNG